MGVEPVPATHEVPQNPHAECMLGSARAAADILNLLPLSDFFSSMSYKTNKTVLMKILDQAQGGSHTEVL